MKISKTLMFLAVAVLPLAGNVGYCNEDIEALKADSGIDVGLSMGDIKEMLVNLVTGRRVDRSQLPRDIPEPIWPRLEPTDITGYDQVRALFKDGILPDEEDLTGWFSGRMFLENRKNVANAALLVGTVTDSVEGGGPLFSAKAFKVRLFDRGDSANYFDEMPYKDRSLYEKNLKELARISPVTAGYEVSTDYGKGQAIFSWPLRFGGPDSIVQGKIVCEVRKSGDHLVVKITDTRFSVEEERSETRYAYFFKNVTPS